MATKPPTRSFIRFQPSKELGPNKMKVAMEISWKPMRKWWETNTMGIYSWDRWKYGGFIINEGTFQNGWFIQIFSYSNAWFFGLASMSGHLQVSLRRLLTIAEKLLMTIADESSDDKIELNGWLVGQGHPSEKYERQSGWLATQYMGK